MVCQAPLFENELSQQQGKVQHLLSHNQRWKDFRKVRVPLCEEPLKRTRGGYWKNPPKRKGFKNPSE